MPSRSRARTLSARPRYREHHHHQLPGQRLRDRLAARRHVQAHRAARAGPRWSHRPHQDRHRIRRRLPQHHDLQHACSITRAASRSEAWTARISKTSSVSNITMRDVSNAPIFLRLGSRMRAPEGTAGRLHQAGQHQQRGRVQRRPALWLDHQRHSGPRYRGCDGSATSAFVYRGG